MTVEMMVEMIPQPRLLATAGILLMVRVLEATLAAALGMARVERVVMGAAVMIIMVREALEMVALGIMALVMMDLGTMDLGTVDLGTMDLAMVDLALKAVQAEANTGVVPQVAPQVVLQDLGLHLRMDMAEKHSCFKRVMASGVQLRRLVQSCPFVLSLFVSFDWVILVVSANSRKSTVSQIAGLASG